MTKRRVLVVDDEPLIGSSLEQALKKWRFDVTLMNDGTQALKCLEKEAYDLVLTDVRMPKISGMDILAQTQQAYPETAVIMITAFGTIEHAVEAMKKGAYDYITKPFSLDEIKLCIERYFKSRRLEQENANLKLAVSEKYALDNFVGQNPTIKALYRTLEMAFESDASVFIQSENGTGKELIASAIHYNSARKAGPFVKLNCAAIPENLIESQLFGHEKGAFTGAIRSVKGVFEEADGGTLLLDEVTEMPIHLQAKLLRVLQEGEFTRLGSTRVLRSDVRIIATSNCDVQSAIEEGEFRQDLYFRLDVISVRISPLRERKDDIPMLCDHFIKKYAAKYGKNVTGISPEVLKHLYNYHWPGNVRELENFIQRCVLSSRGNPIIQLQQVISHLPSGVSAGNVDMALNEDLSIEQMEKRLIFNTLKRYNFHKTKTAEVLGVTLKTLRNKIIAYGLELDDIHKFNARN